MCWWKANRNPMSGLPTESAQPCPPTYPKLRGRKSTTTDWAHHVESLTGLITIVMMTLLLLSVLIHILFHLQLFLGVLPEDQSMWLQKTAVLRKQYRELKNKVSWLILLFLLPTLFALKSTSTQNIISFFQWYFINLFYYWIPSHFIQQAREM